MRAALYIEPGTHRGNEYNARRIGNIIRTICTYDRPYKHLHDVHVYIVRVLVYKISYKCLSRNSCMICKSAVRVRITYTCLPLYTTRWCTPTLLRVRTQIKVNRR